MKLYMFRSVPLTINRSLFNVHSAVVYVIQFCRQLSSRSICSCSKAVYKLVCHIPLLSAQWTNSRWWTEELSETCRVSCQNKFVKLVQLVGFTIKKSKPVFRGHDFGDTALSHVYRSHAWIAIQTRVTYVHSKFLSDVQKNFNAVLWNEAPCYVVTSFKSPERGCCLHTQRSTLHMESG
jgi:hypothetical protein